MAPTDDPSPIRILHLSDFHFRADTAWDHVPVLEALAREIAEEVRAGLVPDFVAITGDLAFSGLKTEYALARDWLEHQLWPALPALPRDRLLLVPGNHDVDRSQVDFVAQAVQGALLNGQDQGQVAKLLGDAVQRETLLKRHAAYLAFLGDWLGKPQSLPWWRRDIELRGVKLRLAGLDSAWLACGNEDRGRLLLSRYQLNQTLVGDKSPGWRIALLHHPLDYLAEFELGEARQTLYQHSDVLLRGHRHEAEACGYVPPDPARACVELAAGCVYEHGRYPNAYQWIELHAQPRKIKVLFRAWLRGAWTIDRNQPGCPDGIAVFDGQAHTNNPGKPGIPTIPEEYRHWLRRHCAGVELLGQEQGRAVTLYQIYVPAVVPEVKYGWKEELLLSRLDQESLYCPAPAGGGKSTFCRWAALQALPGTSGSHVLPAPPGFREPAPTVLRTKLPVLVPLREFWDSMDLGQGRRQWKRADLEQALAAWIDRSPPPGLTGELLKAHLQAGSAFLLLDGLDEVPLSTPAGYPRELLLSGLADALPDWEKRDLASTQPDWQKLGNRVLLTSRPYGLENNGLARLGLPEAKLQPLPKPLQTLFVQRWFHTLDKTELGDKLLAVLQARDDLAPLAQNPMLLAALCVIYANGGNLPEDRYHLYQRIVENVLVNRYPGDLREREPVRARLEAVALGMHEGENNNPRSTPAAEVNDAEIERHLRVFANQNSAYERGRVEPAMQREELQTCSGLLLPRSDGRSAFYHLSLQEFLAAERLARTLETAGLENVFRLRGPSPQWRDTLLFLFAGQCFHYRNPDWGLDLLNRLIESHNRQAVKTNWVLAPLLYEALQLCQAKNYAVAELAENFRVWCLAAIAEEIELPGRQTLGLLLGKLGDPRVKDLHSPAAYGLEVPAGDYPFGKGKASIEQPFRLSRYPVTNSQYRPFIDAGGYREQVYWSAEGWAWLQKAGVGTNGYRHNSAFDAPNQPVVGIRFWEAEAFCRFIGGRLPTEQEWEAATRGPEGFQYPWGDNWQENICNTHESGLKSSSVVGLFPQARQKRYHLDDLAGNVWEWCDSLWDVSGQGSRRVLRGGSWFVVRCSNLRPSCLSQLQPSQSYSQPHWF